MELVTNKKIKNEIIFLNHYYIEQSIKNKFLVENMLKLIPNIMFSINKVKTKLEDDNLNK